MWEPWYERPWVWVLAMIVVVVFLSVKISHQQDRKCAEFMSYAHTSADSMHAAIACQQMKDEAARTAAIAGAAGAIAGSGVGGRR